MSTKTALVDHANDYVTFAERSLKKHPEAAIWGLEQAYLRRAARAKGADKRSYLRRAALLRMLLTEMSPKKGRAEPLTGFDLFEVDDTDAGPSPLDELQKRLGESPNAYAGDRLLKPEVHDLLSSHVVYHFVRSRAWAVIVKPGVDHEKASKKLFRGLVGKRSLSAAYPFLHDMTLYVLDPK